MFIGVSETAATALTIDRETYNSTVYGRLTGLSGASILYETAERLEVNLGSAGGVETGLPHDGFMPLARFVRWVNDEG